MDVFYLAIAYLATLRNWQSLPAFRGRALPLLLPAGRRRRLRADPGPGAATGLPQHVRVLLHRLRGGPEPLVAAADGASRLGRHGRADLDLREAAAGVLDPRRPARRDRHPGELRLGLAAAHRADRRPRRGALVRRPARGCRRPDRDLAVRRGPDARGDGHRRRAVGLARGVGRDPVLGHGGEDRARRADRGDLRPDAAGDGGEQPAAVRRCQRGGAGQCRSSPWPWRAGR